MMNDRSSAARGTRFASLSGGAAAAAAILLLAGCGGKPAGGRSLDTDSDRPVVDSSRSTAVARQGSAAEAYASGRYAAAKTLAETEMRNTSGRGHDRAALIAGMSAHALDQPAEAERILRPLATHDDREIAGRAEACLGLIARGRGEHERAVTLLTAASRKLTGDDGARAALYAGDSLAALGRQSQARTQYAVAGSLASGTELKQVIQDRLDNTAFAVQIGVFSQRANASKAVSEVASAAARLGLGELRIVDRTDATGRPSYVVLLGRFTSRQQAADAQTRLGSGWPVAVSAGE